ncbi:helix-turn-helix domain-containing protein [Sphingosinicella rhizophila]|uniref:XRE family transcriptional regulator n=1 Tax=Sphingosinicella rhizophila TaxID=3050082 RepID=A0ABU3QB90_9SPHN|nr:XRE family transcriptional regulator [Sphingosinicella sp. GR2756]MDT9600669.1 XRE family transcriptional regulator [Sphingosinicella sp. GR2756]
MNQSAVQGRSAEAEPTNPGTVLKLLRGRRGLTLADVSGLTGLPVPTLSKLENGRISFTYDKMMQVAHGLEIDIAQLLSSDVAEAPPVRLNARRSIARKGEGKPTDSGTYVIRHLAADLLDKGFVPMVGDINARSIEEFGPMIQHAGEEFVYVLEGVLELHSSIYAPLRLEQGDSIFFDSDMGHAYVNAGPGPCKVLSICSEPRSLP